MIPRHIKEASKVVGYFSHTSHDVFCDGDACIIAGSEENLRNYLQKLSSGGEREAIKKTRLGEIFEGLRQGGAYAFDEESYKRFLHLATLNGIKDLPGKEFFANSVEALNFIRIQMI